MLYAIAALVIIIFDQSVKYWTVSNIALDISSRPFIPYVIQLVHIRNTGAAFGLLPNGRWMFLGVAVVFVAAVIYGLAKGLIKSPFGRWMAIFALSGTIGNAIDRALYGYVVDMFDPLFINFPVFNVADTFINIGAIGFCLYILFSPSDSTPAEAEQDSPSSKASGAARGAGKVTLAEKLSAFSVARRALKEGQGDSVGIETITKDSLKARFTPPDPDNPFAEWESKSGAERQKPSSEAKAFVAGHSLQLEPLPPAPGAAVSVAAANLEDAPLSAPAASAPAEPFSSDIPAVPSSDLSAAGDSEDAETYSLEDILAEFR